MGAAPGGSELAELLEKLKRRSGRSYEALAHRTGLSRSTVHRYCQGSTVPPSFGAVELVARACGASTAELNGLYGAWQRANSRSPLDENGKADETEPPTEAGREAGTAPAGPAAPSYRSGRSRTLALFLVLVVSVVGTVSYDSGREGRGSPLRSVSGGNPSDRQRFEGPAWALSPRRVPEQFYGLTLNTDTGEMPGFRAGSVRLWESGTRWGSIERRRGHYDWTTLRRMVDAAERKRLPVLFTIGGTPLWAAKDGRRSGYSDSLASPPDDLAVWDRFVEELATRYRGRIEAYELWDYPSHRLHYAGTMRTLAEMVERAARIIRRADPAAKIVCPSFGDLRQPRGERLLREFARTGVYETCDAAALKMPPRKADGPPEEIIDLAASVQRTLFEEEQSDVALWNTGPDRSVALTAPLGARHARDYAVRFYLSGLYARNFGIRRMYFYSWGSSTVPLVVQPVGGPPTEAGRRIARLQQWLDGARIVSCGRGAGMGLAQSAYTCRFERDGAELSVYWTTKGRTELSLPDGAGTWRLNRMDGSTAEARGGARIGFGEEPLLVEHRAA